MNDLKRERRRWPRISVQGLVATYGETQSLPVLMINMGGLLLQTGRFFTLGDEGPISMKLEGNAFNAIAEAVFIGPDNSFSEKKIGLAFRQFEGDSKRYLIDFIQSFQSE